MLENFWYQTISKKKRNLRELLFFWFLTALSFLYGAGLLFRKALYKLNIIKARSYGVKVICAGNITMGGTGKTPFIEEMAKRLIRDEKNVVIVCKGYRRDKKKPIDVVSDGLQILLKQRYAGDEAYMLARAVNKAKVIVADNKLQGLAYAAELFKPDYILLDDGFQKRGDIAGAFQCVLIDAINPVGFGRLFPAGMLREPMNEIKRADAVLITNTNLADPGKVEKIKEMVLLFNKNMKIFESEHQPKMIYNVSTGEKSDLGAINEKKIIAFSSIGNPVGFEKTLKALGAHVIVGLRFRDHHRVDKKEMEAIMKLYESTKASMIITTEKDEVKLNKKHIIDNRVFALKIGMFIKNVKELEKKMRIS
jgi:tetraacyldisaccharide 4'-kinase